MFLGSLQRGYVGGNRMMCLPELFMLEVVTIHCSITSYDWIEESHQDVET